MKSQIIILLLIFGASAIQWLYKTLKQQAEKNRQLSEQRRQDDESLRTGRSHDSPVDPRTPEPVARRVTPTDPEEARLAELARRRQELVAELRRRAAAKQGQPAPTEPPPRHMDPRPRTMSIPAPVRTVDARTGPSRPTPAASPRPSFTRYVPAAFKPQRREPPRPTSEAPEATHRLVPSIEPREVALASSRTPARAGAFAHLGMSASELRRAIVLQEILAKPVSMR
jgi:hypothetical protein